MRDEFNIKLMQQEQYRIRNFDQALILAEELLQFAINDGISSELELATFLKGEALEKLGRFAEAKKLLLRLKNEVCERNKKDELLLDVYECLGKACYAIGELDEALEYWSDCLELALEHQSIEHYIKAYTGVGGIYLYFGLYNDSLHHHLFALDFAKELDNPILSMMLNLWLGSDYNELGKYEQAINHLELARSFYRRRADIGQVCEIIMHLGFSYAGLGDWSKASKLFKESIRIAEEHAHSWPMAMAHMGLAKIFFAKGRNAEALKLILLAHRFSIDNQSIHHELKICQLASQIYEALDDYENALLMFERYYELQSALSMARHKIQLQSAALKKLNRSEVRLKLLKAEQQKKNLENERIQQLAKFAAEKEALIAVNKAKGEFLALVSHEIRTPLSGVIGMLRLALAQNTLPSLAKEQVSIGLENAEMLLEIINDLLDASKIEAGKISLELIPFDLHKIIAQVAALFAPKAQEKGLTFLVDVAYLPHEGCLGDPTRIRQVLFNLISNAIKFTESGSIRLSAYRDGEQIKFSITDTGIGLDEQSLGRLFNKFEQADTSTTRKYGGTGLGLSICRALIELMHGSIAVTSQVGEGTCFRVDLPLEPVDLLEKIDEVLPGPELIPYQMKVLYAEDIPTNQLIVRSQLEELGLNLHVVENGYEALIALSQQDYDLVLMDGRMPVMDGIEATHFIRQGTYRGIDVRDPDIYIVALTANAGAEEQQAGVKAGMNDYLLKPIDPAKLRKAILAAAEYQLSRGKKLLPQSNAQAGQRVKINDADRIFLNKLELAGVAVQEALPRLNNNVTRFKRWLLQFFTEQKPLFAELAESVQTSDVPNLMARVHALRGVAGTLGLTALYEAASQLEQDLNTFARQGGVYPDTSLLERHWKSALDAICPLLDDTAPSPEASASTCMLPEALLGPAKVLKEALLANSLRARTKLQLLSDLVEDESLQKGLQAIERALDRLDYPAALAVLMPLLPEVER
ncbi:ATP-binding protein [Chitinibacter sp. SCUT-21]|uniref:ATP-binding protein n=1 Tax=Chitinibacter sp. SCUT-21 TaxID=2970891 RepID=UPI0035A6C560